MSTHRPLANDPLTSAWAAGLRSSLRAFARTHLPEAMVPAHFMVLPDLPHLPNGKVDRAALPALSADTSPERAYLAPRTPVEKHLARIWQDLLGLPQVGVETSFFDLGGDSLTVLQMAAQIRESYDIRLDLRRMFEDPTVARLARMIGSQADPAVTGAGNPRGIDAEAMRADAVLPPDITPHPEALPATQGPFHHILLTGGTGYTGAFLLRELLDRTPATATVHVLVRAQTPRQATDRVRANLAEYGLLTDTDMDRVAAVPGDTGRPYLGLTKDTYLRLAADTELVIHNAAVSSWIVPYPQLKPVNVFGALEVLRLACRTRIKAVHFVSTIGVYPGHPGERTWHEEALTESAHVVGGYRQSKWVADTLMLQARERGIPTHVHRLGAVTGSQKSGACSPDTFINHLIKGCIQLGAYLDLDLLLDLVPVDHCAAAVSHIALSARSEHAVFNLPSARPTAMNDIFELITAYGYRLRRLDYRSWYRELAAAVERGEDNELARYLPLFGTDQPAEEVGYQGSRPAFTTTHLDAALEGTGIRPHPVDRELFDLYLDHFVATGFLPSPDEAAARHLRPTTVETPTMTTTPAPVFPLPRTHPLDPPPAYRELAAEQPVFQVRTPRGEHVWLVTRHEDARTVLTDLRFSSDPKTPGYPSYISGDTPIPPGFFLNQDAPDHTRLRRLVTREFLITQMEAKRPRMKAILDDLLAAMAARGTTADLVRDLAFPMAATVMCELLDVPYEDHHIFVTLTDTILDRSSTPAQAEGAARELMAYFDKVVTAREQQPTDDMLGRLVAQEEAGKLSHDEFVGLAALLMLSGYDTMAQMIGLGTATLLEHPEQLAALRADPALYPQAVEELLRYLSINHAGLPRAATEDLTLAGTRISKGDGLLVMINAANRDAAVFTEPDTFDIHRPDPQSHVAFGHGFHKCIGLTLARVELSTVFAGLFEKFPTLQPAAPLEELPFRHDMVLYGVRALPVTW
ncbi:thioester reductase domain-containing protein [Streptomyces sp. SCSIO ZS0520]|uniref:thioester reductase domain-containing protein n=1 Tax=Streptomyces sp. SCSIO ZS0520 TaxID=2892996 RepID=UPI0021D8E98C|nr:thioester reductase domain-containing protein [Streptomyces sp. SCSIO ZS0520]